MGIGLGGFAGGNFHAGGVGLLWLRLHGKFRKQTGAQDEEGESQEPTPRMGGKINYNITGPFNRTIYP